MKNLSTLPIKGTSDWFPDEFAIRQYIFTVWRSVCTKFGYSEYLTPLIESSEIYKAKSGEDVGGKELMMFMDKAGRELAIRPEMTPSVTRMVARIYPQSIKPIRYFSIANFIRNEKPQRGRNREFWQLNFDIFGSDSLMADTEILQMACEILLAFNPPKGSFCLELNSRQLIDGILTAINFSEEQKKETVRILDKFLKLSEEDIISRFVQMQVDEVTARKLMDLMKVTSLEGILDVFPDITQNKGLKDLQIVMHTLDTMGYGEYVTFSPQVLRGLDYYDGIVFEAFDKNPENRRSMFGGGRYNGLASLFGVESFPAVGCAPGDETTYLFLQSWGLLDSISESIKKDIYYFPLIDERYGAIQQSYAKRLRFEGKNVQMGLEIQGIGKAMQYADKINATHILLLGENEVNTNMITVKNLITGEQVQQALKN